MKTLLFTYKFLFVTILSIPLALCSNNDEPTQDFESVTINLENTNVNRDDTSFTVDSFQFKSEDAENTPDGSIDGIGIWPGSIELDLGNINGISKISVYMHNNSDPTISLLNKGEVIHETLKDLPRGLTTFELDVKDFTFDSLKIFSYELIVISIKLE